MAISQIHKDDVSKVIPLFKEHFKTHNIFSKPDEEITVYLENLIETCPLFAGENCALFIVKKGGNDSHGIWKFRHFAFNEDDEAVALLAFAEKYISEQLPTSKIELTIAQTEPGHDFFLKCGYTQEGALENHYRWGETCFILSKSIKNKE